MVKLNLGGAGRSRGGSMRALGLRTGSAAIVLAFAPLLAGCESVAGLDCAAIAERAKALSNDRPLPIRGFANVRETLRNDNEVRCAGDATFADGGTAPLHFRARMDDGAIDVAYQGIPYE
jgi:hypothetical protein